MFLAVCGPLIYKTTPWSCFLSAPGDILISEIFLLLEIHLNLYTGYNSWNIWSFEESLLTGQEKFSILQRKYILLTPFMTMHVLRRNQASADFLTECENGHFLSIEPTGKITQLARKGIIWTSTRCSRAWTVNKPSKSTEVCAVCLLFWHFPHLSTIWKFSRYILCTRMWRPGESFNKDLTRTVFSSHCSFCRWLLLLNWMVKFILSRLGHSTPTLVVLCAFGCWGREMQA